MFNKVINFIFGKKSMYAEPWQRGQTIWSIQNDEEYIKQAFNRVVWVYSCVIKLSSCVASIPWVIKGRGKNGKLEELPSHELNKLFNGKVNKFYTSADFFEMWVIYLALTGKFFALYDNPVRPTELTPLHPQHMEVRSTKDNTPDTMVENFRYHNETDYSSNLILWDKFFDPLSFYDGLSPIRAGARTIDTENSAVDWNKDSFDNMGVPPGAIHLMGASKELIRETKRRWKKDYAGAKNARMPMIFDTEKMQYINFGLNQIDMDFLNQRKLTRTEICSLFGVPSQIVGDPEGQTYANYEQALKSLWTDTIIPRYLNKIRQSLNMNIVSKYDIRLFADYDISNIEVLQKDEALKIDRFRGLFTDNLLTQNEAREGIGYEAIPNGDQFNYQLLSNLVSDLSDPEAEGEEDDNISEDGN